jgi:hypothetical protein
MTRRHTPERLTLDAILPHLRTKRVSKRNGERHVLAHCSAHDDSTPSLSLTEKKAIVPIPPKFGAMLGTFGAMSVTCKPFRNGRRAGKKLS